MENKILTQILERLDNIENSIFLIFDELQRRNPDDSCSFAMYASTYFTAQQAREVQCLMAQAIVERFQGNFNMAEFKQRFETFRQAHLPHSQCFSLRLIAEGYLVEERCVDLCQEILDDIEKQPEEHGWALKAGGEAAQQ